MSPDDNTGAAIEMPRYKSHKHVWALKIADILLHDLTLDDDRSATIQPADKGYGPFRVDAEYMLKHKPQVGGYYVQYADGYKSFSPAKAFEEGYTRVDN